MCESEQTARQNAPLGAIEIYFNNWIKLSKRETSKNNNEMLKTQLITVAQSRNAFGLINLAQTLYNKMG